MSAKRLVVAMDGPSGSGKSSAARGVARRLGLRYLDTGAMYRAMTWWMLESGIAVDDQDAVAAAVETPELGVGTNPDEPTIAVDGQDVAGPIRTRAVSDAVSAVSAVPAVRARLVAMQQELIGPGGIVVEGRDITTVVAPDAPVKVFLTADAEVRAHRRAAELGGTAGVEQTLTDQERRDRLDSTRAAAPLTEAPDAVVVDTSQLDLDQVIDRICELAKQAEARMGDGT